MMSYFDNNQQLKPVKAWGVFVGVVAIPLGVWMAVRPVSVLSNQNGDANLAMPVPQDPMVQNGDGMGSIPSGGEEILAEIASLAKSKAEQEQKILDLVSSGNFQDNPEQFIVELQEWYRQLGEIKNKSILKSQSDMTESSTYYREDLQAYEKIQVKFSDRDGESKEITTIFQHNDGIALSDDMTGQWNGNALAAPNFIVESKNPDGHVNYTNYYWNNSELSGKEGFLQLVQIDSQGGISVTMQDCSGFSKQPGETVKHWPAPEPESLLPVILLRAGREYS